MQKKGELEKLSRLRGALRDALKELEKTLASIFAYGERLTFWSRSGGGSYWLLAATGRRSKPATIPSVLGATRFTPATDVCFWN